MSGERQNGVNIGTDNEYYAGVFVTPGRIYSAIYSSDWQECSKAKRSAKAARGSVSVAQRISRTLEDAMDEGDLDPRQLRAVGISSAGELDLEQGAVRGGAFGEDWFSLCRVVEERFQVPVVLEGPGRAGTLGFLRQELGQSTERLGVLLLDEHLWLGVVESGQVQAPELHGRLTIERVLDWGRRPGYPASKPVCRELRRAVRHADAAAGEIVAGIGRAVREAFQELLDVFQPQTIALAGVPATELRELLTTELGSLVQSSGEEPGKRQVVWSLSGRSVWLAGAAMLAAERRLAIQDETR